MVPFFLLLKKFNLLRVTPEQEEQGLDAAIHGGFGYDHRDHGGDDSTKNSWWKVWCSTQLSS